jgi:hypothetical protein
VNGDATVVKQLLLALDSPDTDDAIDRGTVARFLEILDGHDFDLLAALRDLALDGD